MMLTRMFVWFANHNFERGSITMFLKKKTRNISVAISTTLILMMLFLTACGGGSSSSGKADLPV
jgi:hypothetical protein